LYKQNNSLPKVKENRHKMNVYSGPWKIYLKYRKCANMEIEQRRKESKTRLDWAAKFGEVLALIIWVLASDLCRTQSQEAHSGCHDD
jgi:hypothetical protein